MDCLNPKARRSHDEVPDDKYLFSELPHYPRCTIQARFIWVRHRYVVFVCVCCVGLETILHSKSQ